jgi:hypothetical protein
MAESERPDADPRGLLGIPPVVGGYTTAVKPG